MPKKIDYSKTVIYKLCCNDANITDIYVGHTTNLKNRKSKHKSDCNNDKKKKNNTRQYQFIRENGGWDNWSMIVFEVYPCANVDEARARERYWIETLKATLNSDIPNRTKKEYREDMKEVLSTKSKQYREENKEMIAKKKKEYADKNKEILLIKSKQYYEEHKDQVKARVKEYAEKNKEVIAEYNKQYREEKKEILNEKQQQYREENRKIINEKAKERILCECCNIEVPRRHISTHRKSKRHIEAETKCCL